MPTCTSAVGFTPSGLLFDTCTRYVAASDAVIDGIVRLDDVAPTTSTPFLNHLYPSPKPVADTVNVLAWPTSTKRWVGPETITGGNTPAVTVNVRRRMSQPRLSVPPSSLAVTDTTAVPEAPGTVAIRSRAVVAPGVYSTATEDTTDVLPEDADKITAWPGSPPAPIPVRSTMLGCPEPLSTRWLATASRVGGLFTANTDAWNERVAKFTPPFAMPPLSSTRTVIVAAPVTLVTGAANTSAPVACGLVYWTVGAASNEALDVVAVTVNAWPPPSPSPNPAIGTGTDAAAAAVLTLMSSITCRALPSRLVLATHANRQPAVGCNDVATRSKSRTPLCSTETVRSWNNVTSTHGIAESVPTPCAW